MALPGKLCIGILEEDNPQKSYFRFKPLLVANEDKFEVYDVGEEFPENGCIRIVPDKNESSRFKARMRRMGRYCMVDLREHPDENDKIRPNKNYHGDDVETNACIIYSDVVREVPEGTLVEILQQEVPEESERLALNRPAPFTSRVAFTGCVPFGALWSHEPIEDIENGHAFTRTGDTVAEDACQRFDIPGFGEETLSFLIAKPDGRLYEPAPAPAPETRPAPEAKPAAPEMRPAPEARPVPEARNVREPERPAPQEAPANAPKPWLFHDASMLPRPVDPHLPPREQAIAMQTGINPRRGRSLQEIIEEKWRRSRIDQLGHPVPGEASGNPVSNPVDNAVEAVRNAWEYPSARSSLAHALSQIENLPGTILGEDERVFQEKHAAQIQEYETSRDALKAEIEEFRLQKEHLQEDMLTQLRTDNAAEIEEHSRKIHTLEQQEDELEKRAAECRNIAESAEDAIARLTDDKLTARLSEYAINCRASDLLARLGKGELRTAAASGEEAPVALDPITVPALARRVTDYFNQSGCPINSDDAVNLLACFALGGSLLFTGPSGCGKSMQARLLLEALGLSRNRTVRYEPGKPGRAYQPFEDTEAFPGVVLADDINARPMMLERIINDTEPLTGVKVVMTAQDSLSGLPMNVRLLDRCFTLRLRPETSDAPWEPANSKPAPVEGTITAKELEQLFTPDVRNVLPQVKTRLTNLRASLGRHGVLLSRRTLNDLWMYCAAVTPYMSLSPMEVFDLAFAQRALPSILASARVEALHALPELLVGLPRCQYLLRQPLAVEI